MATKIKVETPKKEPVKDNISDETAGGLSALLKKIFGEKWFLSKTVIVGVVALAATIALEAGLLDTTQWAKVEAVLAALAAICLRLSIGKE